jgi:hypothetical protein
MARQSRQFRARNLSVNLAPSARLAAMADKFRLCLLHTNLCLGWTNCRLLTRYCVDWLSWCRFLTCRYGTIINCPGITYFDCRPGTLPPDCGPGSPVIDPGDILTDPEFYARQVAELKADLQQALRQLDEHQKEIGTISREAGG